MELLDKLTKVARKVEKKTVIHLTSDEKKLLAEIEAQQAGGRGLMQQCAPVRL